MVDSNEIGRFTKRLIPLFKLWQRRYSQGFAEKIISIQPKSETPACTWEAILRQLDHEQRRT